MRGIALSIEIERPMAEVGPPLRGRLKEEGFGVLTEIDVQATLRDKLGVEVAPEVILGACNPRLAYAALSAEPGVAVLLPCNVVLRELGQGRTQVLFMDAEAALGLVGNPELEPVAREASAGLRRVARRLEEDFASPPGHPTGRPR